MHPGKEACALHPKDRDEDVGNEDEEDDDSYGVVQGVHSLLVGLFIDVPPGCNTHLQKHSKNNNKTCRNIPFLFFLLPSSLLILADV